MSEQEREAIYWKSGDDQYKVRVFTREEKPGAQGSYASRTEVFCGTVDFETLERLMADQPETRWVHSPPVDLNKVTYGQSEPELVGKLPARQDLTVLPADEPEQRKIGWAVFENVAGADVLKVPTGMTTEEAIEALETGGEVAFDIITTEMGIDAGDVVITQGLFGYLIGPVHRGKDGLYMRSQGGVIGMLQWNPGLKNPRWTCPGHINAKGIKRIGVKR